MVSANPLAPLADDATGRTTIKHGPIKKLGMDEGMTTVLKA
jgi:Cu/Ag efflux protein CusF